ncbi:MAG: ABC transporter ATP-binding protein, partial [Victivallales bacterium]|nr:ABC transporter ATP-binding protein [Victivallales bacterium]
MPPDNGKSEKDKRKIGNIAKILVFMHPYKVQLLGLFALTALLSIIAMFPPLVTRTLVDDVFTQGKRNLFFVMGALMIIIPLVSTVCGFIQSLSIAYLGQRFVFDIRCALYRHYLGLSLRFFSKHSVGKLLYRLMGDS